MSKEQRKRTTEKPISLKPLKFDEAVSDLLKVKPEPKGKPKDTEASEESNNEKG